VGDEAVLGPGDEDHREFQTLGGVDGHKVDLPLARFVVPVIALDEADAVQVGKSVGSKLSGSFSRSQWTG
jgi:hypothetical protein